MIELGKAGLPTAATGSGFTSNTLAVEKQLVATTKNRLAMTPIFFIARPPLNVLTRIKV
jgi:hypothetical protein